ncbi:helix-turn-helix domain-containing protein [Pseudomonas sp. ADAK13]|uniref:helix-turn-helix domain-containing protein n=1 Tax=Pseudomonas sp. ADAK13 TaxID=2730847 RepID=UPI001F023CD7|nr:helix-turn-helix domain-containing protein [Pseudomonas sp. ADAK13]
MEFYSAKGSSDNEGQGFTAIPSFHSTTVGSPGNQGFLIWRQTIELLFDATALEPHDFSASMTVYHFNRFLFCSGRLDGARYCRDRARLKWCDLDHYLLHLPLHKGLVCGDGLRVRRLDVVVLDLSQPAGFSMAQGEGVSLLIPRTALSPLLYDTGQLHGLVLRRESASGVLLAQLLSSLMVVAPRLSLDEALRLTLPMLGMVAACLGRDVARTAAAPRSGPAHLGRRVRLYIEQNLQREDLSPGALAKELGVSRSQLYREFEKFGGVRHYLLQRRLRRCLFALCDPGNATRRISDLAYDHGFADEAHFSRLFRKAFGLSPRAAKTAMQRGDLPDFSPLVPHAGDVPGLAKWVRELISS